MDRKLFVSHIKTELMRQGLTLGDLAARADLSRVTLWRMLSGRTESPRRRTLTQVARALGIDAQGAREAFTGQYELLPVVERLPEDDELFRKALRNQLEAVPEHLRLEAVRAAITAMAGVMHQAGDARIIKKSYHALRELDLARWRARKKHAATR